MKQGLPSLVFATPPFPGKLRLVDTIGKLASWVGFRRTRCSVLPGADFEVDLRDRIERQMWAGCYETHVRKCLEALLGPGDVFLDIGAHIGYHTVVAAGLVGPRGTVFAFEPDPVLHDRLSKNVANFPWVHAVAQAVWERSGTFVFERSPVTGESGWGTLSAVRDLGRGQRVPVEATSLDDWSETSAVDRIQVVKIDAEGSELAILRGGRRLLQRFRPAIVLEVNQTVLLQTGLSPATLADELRELGYELFGLSWPRLASVEDKYVPEAAELLCIPNDSLQPTLPILSRAGFMAQ